MVSVDPDCRPAGLLKRAALGAGLGPSVRWIKRARWQRRLRRDPVLRRNARDDENLRLLLAWSLAPDSNCIDVGCAEGSVLAEILRCAPRGHHIAYEPIPEWHEALVRRFPSVDVRQAALSDTAGESSFVYVKSNPFFSGLRQRTYMRREELETITVRVEALDAALPHDYVPTLIKIDVEGAECHVLAGAIETIARHKPIVVFEHGKGAADEYGFGPADVFRLLCTEAALRIFDLDGNGPYTLGGLQRVFERGEYFNFVAHV